jgi:hypothetical protein
MIFRTLFLAASLPQSIPFSALSPSAFRALQFLLNLMKRHAQQTPLEGEIRPNRAFRRRVPRWSEPLMKKAWGRPSWWAIVLQRRKSIFHEQPDPRDVIYPIPMTKAGFKILHKYWI